MVEKKGFVAKIAPPRPAGEAEEETPLVVGSEEAPAFPGLEFEEAPKLETEGYIGEPPLGEFMVGPTITIEGLDQPVHQPTAVDYDEHAHLPDHVREEILAGRKAIIATESKHGLEMSLGAKLSAQNHARTRPAPQPLVEPRVQASPDMYGKSGLTFKSGFVESTSVLGDAHPNSKVTQRSNYNEGSED